MKKKYKLKKWVKVTLTIMIVTVALTTTLRISKKNNAKEEKQKTEIKKAIKNKENRVYTKEIVEEVSEEQPVQEVQPVQEEIIQEPEQTNESTYETRMTSYYNNDGYETGTVTGSGLGVNDFEINSNGWYTYQGKLVIATATEYLLKYGFSLAEGVHTYRYYDELTLNIDGIDYQAIVLDSCGSSMKNGRIDLFVSSEEYIKDTTILVKEGNKNV